MTLGAGAVAIRRLKLLVSPRDLPLPVIAQKLAAGAVSPLAMDDTREESLGFAHPFSGEPLNDDIQSLVYDGSLVFAFRKDSKKIPGTLFRLQLKAAFEALQNTAPASSKEKGAAGASAEGGRRRKLSKAAREQAKDRIKQELMRRTLPSIRLVEVVWHLDSGEIWLLSTSAGALEDFEKLFFEHFALAFVQVGPGTASVDFDRIHLNMPVTLEPLLELVPIGLVRGVVVDPQEGVERSGEVGAATKSVEAVATAKARGKGERASASVDENPYF